MSARVVEILDVNRKVASIKIFRLANVSIVPNIEKVTQSNVFKLI